MAFNKTAWDNVPKQGQRVLVWVNSKNYTNTVSGEFGYDKNKGREVFILDCGGVYAIEECPLWKNIELPTQKEKEHRTLLF